MYTNPVINVNGKWYNRYNEEIISCKNKCGRHTTMLGTKLCDPCWERLRYEERTAVREPLSDEQISIGSTEAGIHRAWSPRAAFRAGVRWAELKHGIGIDPTTENNNNAET